MNRKEIVKFKIFLSVVLGILINYICFLLFRKVIFDVGSAITVGACAYILYNESIK